ncbi:MAG: hypothetical protein DHS20C21_23300 [Gemmatimonadota bacterium]|nr:MAG: hypothetical protein DHS20C21_23300 [Gemmatimonadota bacterium]
MLKRQLGKRRLKLTGEDRRRLAVRGKALGRKLLGSSLQSSHPTRSSGGIIN